MIVELRGVGFSNKGAELMMQAMLEQLRRADPNVICVVVPGYRGTDAPFDKRAAQGLYQKAWLWRYGIQWGNLAELVPYRIREMYGVILDKEVDLVLDASGFAHGDQWGVTNSKRLAYSARRWRKQGTKAVLLPQAFGPLESSEIRRWVKRFVEDVDLIYARDHISYAQLLEAAGLQEKIRQCPDFTNLVQGALPEGFDRENCKFCIVPNHHMIDKVKESQAKAYVPFLTLCVQELAAGGYKPFILIHEVNDRTIGQAISAAVGGLPVIQEEDPVKIKGILGACEGVISSRFHGLVNALSQGVPSLATGWSHKYEMLLEDYQFGEGMFEVKTDPEYIAQKIALITDSNSRGKVVPRLTQRSTLLKEKTSAMWREVLSFAGLRSS